MSYSSGHKRARAASPVSRQFPALISLPRILRIRKPYFWLRRGPSRTTPWYSVTLLAGVMALGFAASILGNGFALILTRQFARGSFNNHASSQCGVLHEIPHVSRAQMLLDHVSPTA